VRYRNLLAACSDQHKTLPKLRNAIVGEFDNVVGDRITLANEPLLELLKVATALARGNQTGNILKHAHLRFDLANEAKKLPDEAVAVVPQGAALGQASEALAWRTPSQQIDRLSAG
jgi:hypothetical protein